MDRYSETLKTIYNLRGGAIDLRLDRVARALSLFGQPQKSYPAFHIAGTNGKGSTAAMLHRILYAAGYRVALYTSPHVVSFTERIQVGDEEISPEEVVALADEIRSRTAAADIALTFFEFVTVMALVYFARRKVQVAVVEVGLGGRLDATNLVVPVVSLITTISKDHEAYLGSDLLSIAREKGGIIKNGAPVVLGVLPLKAAGLLEKTARAQSAPCHILGRDFSFSLKEGGLFDYRGWEWDLRDLSLALRGDHQRRNAAVALAALEVARREFPVGEAALRRGLATVVWPGRLEIVLDRPTVILDGAHNGEGVQALVEEMRRFRTDRKIRLVFAAMEDKDWRLMLGMLSAVAAEAVLTRVAMERSADPQLLASALAPGIPVRVIEDSQEAVRRVLREAETRDIILVAGSLYLLGEIRPMLRDIAVRTSAERKVLDSSV